MPNHNFYKCSKCMQIFRGEGYNTIVIIQSNKGKEFYCLKCAKEENLEI